VSADDVVVDASLALKWTIEEPYSAEARALLANWHNNQRRLLAPALFLYEVSNVLAKRMRRGQLVLEQAKERLRFLVDNGPLLRQAAETHFRALEFAVQLRLPSAYDARYLALAEFQRCECWTADERLWNSVKKELAWVRWIGESSF
jgi:predicted nucleic acid-binding protein